MQKASFSNTLDRVQYGIWAPGVGILSTYLITNMVSRVKRQWQHH